ncbi:MAG: DUF5685 family protein [Streptosporangiaceae bacterium]
MFGVVRPCRHGLCATLFKEWMAHLCGLCLTLRDEHGHAARVVTNYDGLLVSVLTEAQAPELSPHRRAAACAFRGFRTADVVTARAQGARLAAAVSLLLAAGKTRDHIEDRDGPYARRIVAAGAGRVAGRWDGAGGRMSETLGFDATILRDAVFRQTALERSARLGLLELTEPTETAVAAAFAHTAVLAGRPGNAESLAEAGRFFGRLAHLLDAVEDLYADHEAGAYNPLIATGTGLTEARRHCDDALHGLRLALAEIEFDDPRLVKALLRREVGRSVDRTFAAYGPPGEYPPPGHYPPPDYPGMPPGGPHRPSGFDLCLAGAAVGCTCGFWRPPWSPYANQGCSERCVCTRHCDGSCDGCDCGCCDCCNGCDCCDCGCGCDC